MKEPCKLVVKTAIIGCILKIIYIFVYKYLITKSINRHGLQNY